MKIVVLDGFTLNPGDLSWQQFESIGDLTIYERTPEELVCERIGDAEIVITNKTTINEEIMAKCPSIQYIGVLATGYDVVDIEAAKRNQIVVTNVPTYGTETVAQFTFGLLLELCLNIGLHSDSVKNGEWQNNQDWCYWKKPLLELSGKTIGIVGFGRIGQNVGRVAKAFGMNVNYFDLNEIKGLTQSGDYHQRSLDGLLRDADVVTLHCPLTKETKNIINCESLSKMKATAFLINCARGGLVDEEALATALNSGEIAGAAVDVVSTEPIKAENPLLGAENILITPHMAWGTKEARSRIMQIAWENVEGFLNDQPKNSVN